MMIMYQKLWMQHVNRPFTASNSPILRKLIIWIDVHISRNGHWVIRTPGGMQKCLPQYLRVRKDF